jgi:hypothetical protein
MKKDSATLSSKIQKSCFLEKGGAKVLGSPLFVFIFSKATNFESSCHTAKAFLTTLFMILIAELSRPFLVYAVPVHVTIFVAKLSATEDEFETPLNSTIISLQ